MTRKARISEAPSSKSDIRTIQSPDAGRGPASIYYLATHELNSEGVSDIRFPISYFT